MGALLSAFSILSRACHSAYKIWAAGFTHVSHTRRAWASSLRHLAPPRLRRDAQKPLSHRGARRRVTRMIADASRALTLASLADAGRRRRAVQRDAPIE